MLDIIIARYQSAGYFIVFNDYIYETSTNIVRQTPKFRSDLLMARFRFDFWLFRPQASAMSRRRQFPSIYLSDVIISFYHSLPFASNISCRCEWYSIYCTLE